MNDDAPSSDPSSPPAATSKKASLSAERSESRRLLWLCPWPCCCMVRAAMAAVGGGSGSRAMGCGGLEEERPEALEAWERAGDGVRSCC